MPRGRSTVSTMPAQAEVMPVPVEVSMPSVEVVKPVEVVKKQRAPRVKKTAPVAENHVQESVAPTASAPSTTEGVVKKPRAPRKQKAVVPVKVSLLPEEEDEPVTAHGKKHMRKYRILLDKITPAIQDTKSIANKNSKKSEPKNKYKGGSFKGSSLKQACTKMANRIASALLLENPSFVGTSFDFTFAIEELLSGVQKKSNVASKQVVYNATCFTREKPVEVKRNNFNFSVTDADGVTKKFTSTLKDSTGDELTASQLFLTELKERIRTNTNVTTVSDSVVDNKHKTVSTVTGMSGTFKGVEVLPSSTVTAYSENISYLVSTNVEIKKSTVVLE